MGAPSALDVHDYLLQTQQFSQWMITLADTKASILAGGAAVFLALVFGKLPPSHQTIGDLLIVCGVALVLASALSSLACLWPRVGRPSRNLLFYPTVAGMSTDAYEAELLGMSRTQFDKDVAAENHALASVQLWKYRYLRAATLLLTLGLPLVAIGWSIGGL